MLRQVLVKDMSIINLTKTIGKQWDERVKRDKMHGNEL